MTTMTTCPSFIDLKALAKAAPRDRDDPFGTGATEFALDAGPCTVKGIALSAGGADADAPGGDLFVLVAEGAVTLTGPDGEVALATGEGAVIARGTPFAWTADADATLIGMSYPGGEGGPPRIVKIDNGAALTASNPPADDVLLSDRPSCRSNNHFLSEDGQYSCGVWDSTPYTRRAIFFHHTELMHLLAGEVTFTDAVGTSATFSKGDIFIIEKGAECTWDSQVDVAKIYSLFRPAA
ncbi:cupin domain-containing protein [Croceicoccus sp. YJ47]|uniref:cupin domain-containing protein n=1 Tax=Croceicoccus sp. YJ47 TaxID=2798724 RepID=UPI00192424BC|nr:cupin domain-containing protein [Croceicoccus sp. YJ47]QQN74947.1 cupin domain-containing protein [Croceicoccus sp. YJ47]